MNKIDWDKVVEDLGPQLYRYFLGSFNQDLSDDLTQETLLRLVRKHQAGFFKPSMGSLRMYAFGIARFIRLEAYKKVKTNEPIPADFDLIASDADTFSAVSKEQDLNLLRKAVQKLNSDQQEVLLLSINQDMSLKDISSLLNMPIGTVKSHVHRAKKELLNLLSPKQGESYE